MSQHFLSITPGEKIKSYLIHELIGTGSFGKVYKAYD